MLESLSSKQKEIVCDKTGKFVVRACPGSGKTYCVSARLSRLINSWQNENLGIAALSFTNVAWREIEKKCTESFGTTKITYPHFLGTIDSFINKFIFLPHGHLVLGCNKRPILVGEPHGLWTGKFFQQSLFDKLTYSIDGKLYTLNALAMPRNWEANVAIPKMKRDLNKAGYATQSDANYFAMCILEKFPSIAKALALRFPYLIVDEAQDTSDIQMRIIDILIENGLQEVMLVGDPDQAIFEWNDAKPDLLVKKFNDWPNSIVLNENRRSSQLICNATYSISSLDNPSVAVTESVRDFNVAPKIVVYNNNLPAIVDSFVAKCREHGVEVNSTSTAIIYRSSNVYNEITRIAEVVHLRSPWLTHDSYTKDFAKGKFLYDNGKISLGFKLVEKAIVKSLKQLSAYSEEAYKELIQKHGYIPFKRYVWKFIQLLPLTDATLEDWVNSSNAVFREKKVNLELAVNNYAKGLTFSQLFPKEKEEAIKRDYRLGTVHNVKGETFDATLLILKTRGIGKGYKAILNENVPITESEELRIAYVGLTRARKILMLAVPNEDNKTAWENKLITDYNL